MNTILRLICQVSAFSGVTLPSCKCDRWESKIKVTTKLDQTFLHCVPLPWIWNCYAKKFFKTIRTYPHPLKLLPFGLWLNAMAGYTVTLQQILRARPLACANEQLGLGKRSLGPGELFVVRLGFPLTLVAVTSVPAFLTLAPVGLHACPMCSTAGLADSCSHTHTHRCGHTERHIV